MAKEAVAVLKEAVVFKLVGDKVSYVVSPDGEKVREEVDLKDFEKRLADMGVVKYKNTNGRNM